MKWIHGIWRLYLWLFVRSLCKLSPNFWNKLRNAGKVCLELFSERLSHDSESQRWETIIPLRQWNKQDQWVDCAPKKSCHSVIKIVSVPSLPHQIFEMCDYFCSVVLLNYQQKKHFFCLVLVWLDSLLHIIRHKSCPICIYA